VTRPAVNPRALDPRLLDDRARAAAADLRAIDATLAGLLEPYLEAHARWPEGRSYRVPPASIQTMQRDIVARWDSARVAAFHKAALLEGMRRTREALRSHERWPHSLPYFDDNVVRMLTVLDHAAMDALTYPNDIFAKNIALATGRMWHAKATLVEPRLGISRAHVYRAPLPTPLRALPLRRELGGFYPMYEIHLYDHLLDWFTEEGWAECYRMIARAMAKDPPVRGLFGSTWFFDPALEGVSPRLAFLYRYPVERGARFLRVRTTQAFITLALAKSETRRRMFAEGTYRPKVYLMVWTRASMLRWLALGTP
jgi:hypothetical protein